MPTATTTRTLTMSDPEVQVHLQFTDPAKVTVNGETKYARSANFSIRNGEPGRVLANVDTPDGLSKLVNMTFDGLPEEVRTEVANEFMTRMVFAPRKLGA